MITTIKTLSDQRGFAIFGAILVLALVTIIGIAAISTSTSGRRTATNFMLYERVFYSAEAGLEHVKEAFKNTLRTPANIAVMAIMGRPDWSFALNGATATSYAGGVTWISDQSIDVNTYTITVWDNDDGDGNPAHDSDGLIFIRSDAVGPQNSSCSIETLVTATATSDPIHGYNAQEGGGSGKNFTSNDANGINFSAPGFGAQSLHVGG
jgi:type IV pilus assembly protein PilX